MFPAETRSPEESRRVLASLTRRASKLEPRFDPPQHSNVEVATPTLIGFSGDAVPPNFANIHLPHVRPRWQGPSRWSVAEDWRSWAAKWGALARSGGWQTQAAPVIEVVFHRVRRLDKDGRFVAAKPILDGLVDAGLLFSDDSDAVDENYDARQMKVDHFGEQRTMVHLTRL